MKIIKYIVALLLFCSKITLAQQINALENDESIAKMEMAAHQNANQPTSLARTYSSNNFDVKYYKCEWEVDPAIRFINGKVTIYFKPTEPTSTIILDLMSQLTVDSVKKNNSNILYSQTANTLDLIFPTTINVNRSEERRVGKEC